VTQLLHPNATGDEFGVRWRSLAAHHALLVTQNLYVYLAERACVLVGSVVVDPCSVYIVTGS